MGDRNTKIRGDQIKDGTVTNDELADDTIKEVKLDIHNAPAVDKILGYTSNELEWVDSDATIPDNIYYNITLNAFRIAINGSLSRLNMVDGVVDEFEDETGIDGTSSTNELYDSTDDYYYPSTTYGSDVTGSGTASADSVFGAGYEAVKAFINDDAAYWQTADVAFPHWLKYDFGEGVTKTINKYRIRGFNGATRIYDWKNWTFQGSNNDSDWDTLDTQTNETFTQNAWNSYEFDNLTAYRYYRWVVTANFGSNNYGICEEAEMIEGTYDSMTLISENVEAEVQPDTARIILFEEDISSITINTDLKAYVSRDDGTTYTQITLVDKGDYETNKRILAASVDISGQPADKTMLYKITTHNNKGLKLHGVGLLWD